MDRELDNTANKPIVSESQLNKKTPPDGAGNTNGGLTTHAGISSEAATQNPISVLTSRQLLSSAVDGSFDRKVEYCAPPQEVVDAFIYAAHRELGYMIGNDTASRQGFRQFLTTVIRIATNEANRRSRET